MLILLSLIVFHFLILLVGKYTKKMNYMSYLSVGILTLFQIGVVIFLIFSMEEPKL
ncbi:MAG: hypothetical protein JJ892_07310 [Balneola sp.]|nr:hypothetical protein [Balneola sp.]MBO6800076.1 hypothetical protein [Balneola sp.]MBO6871543.1 hypothetical protein [Balneola sp.]